MSMRIHNVFHVSLLEPHQEDKLANRKQPPPGPVLVGEQEEYEVEAILDSKKLPRHKGKVLYRVKWLGYDDPSDDSWVRLAELENSPDLVADFHRRYPDKPRAISD